ncbi:MAG: PIN domain-containing protein [Candidatus Rokuibacteriota bacterium]|nr:MAG: PIN domain-containing protein [Candidatus Rokubacteria bacterium]
MADLRVFLDANVLFSAAYSPDGLSALLVEVGAAGRVTLLTSALAVIEAERNLEAKRPSALAALRAGLATVRIVAEPSPADVGRLTPPELSSKDRPLLAAALAAHATHFVTGDVADFGPWITRRARLPLQVMTPRQFLTEVRP